MTKTLAEKIAVMQAAERGEQIEWHHYKDPKDIWKTQTHCKTLAWNWFECDYRVVKKPIKLTRYFVVGQEEKPVSLPFTDIERVERSCEAWNALHSHNKPFRIVAFEMTEIEANQNDTTS